MGKVGRQGNGLQLEYITIFLVTCLAQGPQMAGQQNSATILMMTCPGQGRMSGQWIAG